MTPDFHRFAALGDSITEGYGMDPVPGVEPLPWPARVARSVGAELHNLGRRGLRAAEIRATQLEPALALEPDLVSIGAGANDMLDRDFDPARVERELDPLYAAFAATGATVVTFTYLDSPSAGLIPAPQAAAMRERMAGLHAVIERVADRHGALLADLFPLPGGRDPRVYSRDRIHPNAAGHRLVADHILRALARASHPKASLHAA